MMNLESFRALIAGLTAQIRGRELNQSLQDWLNTEHGPQSQLFSSLSEACQVGAEQGWLCDREAAGIRFGRVFKPADDLSGFSVDVVDMCDVVGPHHEHPGGEIDLIMPVDAQAQFDGHDAGWLVYGPDSAHRPTVSSGRAFVLYLLPAGQITFTGN